MYFIETAVFTKRIIVVLSAEEYRALQLALARRPQQGALIRGSGGLRKLRWGSGKSGKRGGIRVIYYWSPAEDLIYMLFAYRKGKQSDLTTAQISTLRSLVREELK